MTKSPQTVLTLVASVSLAGCAVLGPGAIVDTRSPGATSPGATPPGITPGTASPENERSRLRREAWARAVEGIAFTTRVEVRAPLQRDAAAVRAARARAAAAMDSNLHTEAVGAFVEVVRARPNDPAAYRDLGRALITKSKVEEARAAYATALALDDRDVESLLALADLHARAARYDDAVTHAERALDIAPGSPAVEARLALWSHALGRVDAARAHAERAGDAVPPQFAPLLDGVRQASGLNRGTCVTLTAGPQLLVDFGGAFSASETTAAASDALPDVVVGGWNDWRQSGAFEVINSAFSVTTDGGATWQDELVRPPVANRSTVEGDPMACVDPRTGTIWAGAISFAGNGGVYVARLDPGSTTFNDSVMADATPSADKCWMAAGPLPGNPASTRVYVAYNLGVIHSDTMGDTWSNPVSLGSGIGWLPRIGPAGELYVLGWDFGNQLILKRSLDGGLTFTTHLMATRLDTWSPSDGSRFPGTFRVPALGYFDIDETTGDLYGVYYDRTSFDGVNHEIDIYWTRSQDQGETWTTPRLLNDVSIPGDQCFTWLEIDSAGVLHLVYLDTRHTAQVDGQVFGFYDAYYAVSDDHGEHWTEVRLTPASWNSNDDGLNRSQQFLGDYLGMAIAGDTAWPMYIDTTGGDPDIMTNAVRRRRLGDATGDGVVDIADVLAVLADWGACADPCPSDVDCDGMVAVGDLLTVLAEWD